MDPKIIPFGWGLFRDDDEVLVIERGEMKKGENNNNKNDKGNNDDKQTMWFLQQRVGPRYEKAKAVLVPQMFDYFLKYVIIKRLGLPKKILAGTMGNISGRVVGAGLKLRRTLICQFQGEI